MESTTLVIKVRYGDNLRRFNARVNENEQLDLDMGGLRAKILGLFNFPLDADLTLTYIDEDGDVVTLVDDDDLRDVMRQRLKFLRINVQLNNDKYGKSYARSSGSSTPLRSPRVQPQLPNINSGVTDVLKSVPEPFREALSKLSLEFASKASSSNPVLADLVEIFSKMGPSFLNPVSQSLSGADASRQSGAAESVAPSLPTDSNPLKDRNMQEVLPKSNSTPVDLNLDPPCDSNPSGYPTLNSAPAASNVPPENDRKDANERDGYYSVKPVASGAPTSSADPIRPSNLNVHQIPDFGGNPSNECPFSGIPFTNALHPVCHYRPIKSTHNRSEAMAGVFHRGVQCDGCGVHPITGPRYKSKVKEDYDLCSICFSEMGSEVDYMRIDRPMTYRHARSLKAHDLFSKTQHPWVGGRPALPHILRGCGIKPVCPNNPSKLNSRFISDVNVLDGTMMAPSTPFTKIWRMRNNGSIAWPQGAQLMWIGGDKFSDAVSAEIEIPAGGLPVDGELDIAVDFTSPELPGRYISYWKMASPSGGKFGQRVWVLIQVDASLKDSFCDSFQGLNLNLPPASSGSKGPEIIDVNIQPVVDGGFLVPCNTSTVTAEPVKPMVDVQPKKDQELNFPINDSLLVGHGVLVASAPPQASSPVSYPIVDLSESLPAASAPPPQASSPVSYPIVDLSESIPAEPSHTPYLVKGAPSSSEGVNDIEVVEQTLLKELEDMGFKQIDLNKEVLRMNDYNLEQSVDDLCGAAEWDPILEELQEMGFCDGEMNKKLLKKNNGSIKRVVMDLLTGEKA